MFNSKKSAKKEVIAYIHSHWDREWYREFEIFRLRLLRVFDNVLNLLENNKIPSFYFDGQVAALLDYLELRPEKESLVKDLIAQKKLFIGPFYCLVDEYLTDGICFRKNLEFGLKIASGFGCSDFIGYLADTFGHSQNIPDILSEYGIDKAVVWRGVNQELPSEFKFNGIDTVNLVRGYYMDIFSSDIPIAEKAKLLEKNLDIIAERSSDILLLPIGADHLGVPEDILEQVDNVNAYLNNYNITVSSIFDYFNKVKFKKKYNGELRDNSATFILPGTYSSRIKLKQLNTECSYRLDLANKIQFNFGNNYESAIDYAYKLLLKNQAHDSICGCSTDEVHRENIVRYNKILQIANTIIEEIKQTQDENVSVSFKYYDKHKIIKFEKNKIDDEAQVISTRIGVPSKLLYDTSKIPVTEDFQTLYTQLKEIHKTSNMSDLKTDESSLSNSNIKIEIINGKINLYYKNKCYPDFIEFVRCKDCGDTYNFAPAKKDSYEIADIRSVSILYDGNLRAAIKIDTSFFPVIVYLDKQTKLLNFKIKWSNLLINKLWQVKFNLNRKITEVYSEDLNCLIKRKFDPMYDIRENLPKSKGKEAKTNTAPMQRFAWTNGFGVITHGLHEYEVSNKSLSITLLRSVGIISKPDNPARTTPAGPPILVPEAQQLGENSAEFSIGFFDINEWAECIEEVYPQTIVF